MADIVKRQFRVGCALEDGEPLTTMKITTTNLSSLNEVLHNIYGKRKHPKDWSQLIVHETLADGTVQEIPHILVVSFAPSSLDTPPPTSNKLTLVKVPKAEPLSLSSSNYLWRFHANP